LYSLVKYTDIPNIWKLFELLVQIAPMHKRGYSLACPSYILESLSSELFESVQLTHYQLWQVMSFFLDRLNTKYQQYQKMAMNE